MLQRKQQGIALLTAMIVAFLCVAIGVELGVRQQLLISVTDALLGSETATLARRDLEMAAISQLREAQKQDPGAVVDSHVELPVVNGGWTGYGELLPLQNGFNVNDLHPSSEASEQAEARLRRLLSELGLDPDLANAVRDWVDPDSERRHPQGAEDDVYIGMQEGYRAANDQLVRVEELKRVSGMTPTLFARLSPFIASLPTNTPVNVNTAPKEVLLLLSPDMTLGHANAIMERRREAPFQAVEDVLQLPNLSGLAIDANDITVESSHYRLTTTVTVGDRTYQWVSHLHVESDHYQVLRFPGEV